MKKIIILAFNLLIILSSFAYANCDSAVTMIDTGSNDIEDYSFSDVDQDGDIDIFLSDDAQNFFFLYINEGSGSFNRTIVDNAANPFICNEIADFNNDGIKDLIGNDQGSGRTWVYFNEVNGTFTEYDIGADGGCSVGDYDGDGSIEVAICDGETAGYLAIYDNNGDKTFTFDNEIVAPYCYDITSEDIDGDGDLDLAVSNDGGGQSAWVKNQGSLNFIRYSINTNNDASNSFYVEDLNGDGNKDLISATYNTGIYPSGTIYFLNNGYQSFTAYNFTEPNIGNCSTYVAGTYDIDGDGDLDVLSQVPSNCGDGSPFGLIYYENIGGSAASWAVHNLTDSETLYRKSDYVDLTGDLIKDVLFSSSGGIGYIDGSLCSEVSSLISGDCGLPKLFCDDFDYSTPMIYKQPDPWYIYYDAGGSSIDEAFTPIDNRLNLSQDNQSYAPFHNTPFTFDIPHTLIDGDIVPRSPYSPVFTSQFDMKILSGCLGYRADSLIGDRCYDIMFCVNQSIYYKDSTGLWTNISKNFEWTPENGYQVKIITKFGHRDVFLFNSSIPEDSITILMDNKFQKILTETDDDIFIDGKDCQFLNGYYFTKSEASNVAIDNYLVFLGTSNVTNTIYSYYQDYYDAAANETEIGGALETTDLAKALYSIWDDMGLKSASSRGITALFLCFIIAIVFVVAGIKTGNGVSIMGLLLIEFFFVILLAFIRLISWWIPISVVLLSAGIGAFVFKSATNN